MRFITTDHYPACRTLWRPPKKLLDKLNFCLKFVHGKVADCEPTKLAFSVEAEKRHRTWVV
ncbi:hypothetical protein ACF1BQ_031690 [Bradyrhizobium sp. RDT10]